MKELEQRRIALTGFMGVGKSTVSRHLCRMLEKNWVDLDFLIEKKTRREVAEIVEEDGLDRFRAIETECLQSVLKDAEIDLISLGGGAFTVEENRRILKAEKVLTVWLEAPFEHCWANISSSYKDRPLARDRKNALKLFKEREKHYCLAEWHFLVEPGCNSFEVASQIAEQVYGYTPND